MFVASRVYYFTIHMCIIGAKDKPANFSKWSLAYIDWWEKVWLKDFLKEILKKSMSTTVI